MRLRMDKVITILLISSTIVAQQPVINSLSSQEITRSGRLKIFGTNFGTGGSESRVLIDGYEAIVTRWSQNQINAYIPELANTGQVSVQIFTPHGSSNIMYLNVKDRQQAGRVKWIFEADCDNLWFRPAIGPDGTVYVHGSEGFVFALSPDGGLKWVHKVNWYPYVPPQVDSQGVIYVGSIKTITAINPDGTRKWQFTDETAQGVQCGPTIGPDGNLYLAFDGGLGAVSLSTDAQLRWNNPGSPILTWYGSTGAETVLGPREPNGSIEQMYVVAEPQSSSWTLQCFRLSNGSLRFSVPIGGQHYTFGQQQTQPIVGPDGTIYITHMSSQPGIGWVLEAFRPNDGRSLWYYHGNATSGMTPPDIGQDGIIYYSEDVSRIIAFNTNTRTPKWEYYDGSILYYPKLSPLNDVIVLGGVKGFGDVGFIKALSVNSGELLWTVQLPGEFYPAPRVVPVHRPEFTRDGKIVYVSTTILGGNASDPHSYLYAIITGDTTLTDVENKSISINKLELHQNYPNPFNGTTIISFSLDKKQFVKLSVYDLLGRKIDDLVRDEMEPGEYSIKFDSEKYRLSSGIYFYQLMSEGKIETRKMIYGK